MGYEREHLWAIVLAAGEGSRLKSLTMSEGGVPVPKQFCSFQRPHSMLRDAILRAERLTSKERILTIVSPQHRPWWEPELSDLSEENIVIQPSNRGTAAGVLLPLLEIMRRDPDAQILVLPSDHLIEDEEVLERAFARAIPAAHSVFRRIVLLGITPDVADPDYGWIVPLEHGKELVYGVESFVEKPDIGRANQLFSQGGLWNSFMFTTSAETLLYRYQEILPDLLRPMMSRLLDPAICWDFKKLTEVYETLPTYDFSKHLLERVVQHLGVLPVPHCGWSDLGTPERIRRCWSRVEEKTESGEIAKSRLPTLVLPGEWAPREV